uniref:leucine-rich repeat and IQ domain-containing protein 3-like isoform X3 n=1 Tax=Pristiophorus japonicus TaxID=55135 RepID=UPI00398E79C8
MACPGGKRPPQRTESTVDLPPISTDMRRQVKNNHLVSASKSLILSHGVMDHMYKENNLDEMVIINLSGYYLKNLGYLTSCRALRICILSSNYIIDIDALSYCPCLIKLDVHGNHITDLPDEFFWSNMKYLQVLYLHDNIIGDLNSIKPLYYCPSLIVLTLFDTPVSLVPKYRHNLVNNIWTLKVLDNFVIADEEVIEYWPKSNQFKALSPDFFIHLPVPTQVKGSTEDDQCNAVSLQIDINKLQLELLEDRCEAKELTSGIYPSISQWSRWNTPNFKQQKSNIFRHRTFRQSNFGSRPDIFELESPMGEEVDEEEDEEEDDEEDADKDILEMFTSLAIIQPSGPAGDRRLHRHAAGADVRLGIQQLHEMLRNKPQPKFTYQPPITLNKRLYAKSYGCMNLAPFKAIQKAYRDRDKAVKQRVRVHLIRQLKAVDDQAKSKLREQALTRNYDPFRKYKEDQARGVKILLQRKIDRAESLKLVRQSNFLFLEEKNWRESDHQLAKTFNSRYTTMSEALLKRKIRAKNENIHQQNFERVQNIRKQANQLKEEIKDFMMHKQLVMQLENNAARTATNTILLQASKERLLNARSRVAALKAGPHAAKTKTTDSAEQSALNRPVQPAISPRPSSKPSAPEI